MPKVTLEYNLPEETEEMQTAIDATKLAITLSDIQNEVFRPSWKHGYHNEELSKLLEKEEVSRAIELIHEMFLDVLKENDTIKYI